jgi:hypothetical protein
MAAEQQVLLKFIDQVRWLYEPEYGDFKRKVGLYIQRLEESAPALKKGQSRKVLDNMKSAAMFDPNGDIESTRRKIIQLAHELTGAVGGQVH